MPQTRIAQRNIQPGHTLSFYSKAGGSIKAEPLSGNLSNVTLSANLSNQRIYFVAVFLPNAATITGFKWWQATAGDYTANNYNGGGVYSISAGTLTLLASSTDDGNIWKAGTNTLGSKAFSSTIALAAGLYFIGFLYCRSAAVTEARLAVFASAIDAALQGADFANSARLNTQILNQTALPTSQAMSGLTAVGLQNYVALY